MKRIILSTIILLVFASIGKAQVEPHAIGLRLGGGTYGNGGEVSYQHGFGDANRLELGLGWSGHRGVKYMSVAGVYQWVWAIDGGFNWYAGPGAQFVRASANGYSASAIAVGGQIGVEYNFNENDVPLLLSLDTRPMFNLSGNFNDNIGWGFALGIRYTF